MNCIFILLCLLQIVYSSVDQNKHAQSAKDLQIQNYPMPKGYCWRITFYISRKLLSGTSNYITVQLINDETRVFSNRLPCSDKCERGSQPSFYFCTPQIDPVKEVKLNETVKHFWNGLTSVWRLESIDLMNLNTSANYRCTLDNPDADEKGCKLNPTGYCWRIKFYISRKLLSGTSNYITVQLINDETRVFSNRLSCAKKCKRGSQPSFYFCTPQIDPVKELQLNETVKNFWKGFVSGWTLESIDLMNLNTSAEYRCTLDYPGAEKKGCKLNPAGYCWRITFYISSNYFSGTSNYFTVQLINDETRVFSKKLSCAKKCKRGSQPSFDFCTPQIDPVKELKLNETVKNFFKKFTSGWRLESINLMNLNTSATYSCTFSNPGADEKGCKLNPKVIAM
ncbi:uncharacterized protein LOC106876762 isoform X2 [Octopus bimaculoides]|uniref:Ig-like domain-containing protein n=1 Tax=Octopus bimaculoides TaxID=37653 RepID=A0A0L8GI40_OCTBM|nr:uncharacterized protein LOC106876762 isoform X2 [Octopus bimaculoides]|eukprot:XP_014780936.1 PREDICTED: uncharacterized protein LOC106876762 isoform X2 [Octopus bimaculoides]